MHNLKVDNSEMVRNTLTGAVVGARAHNTTDVVAVKGVCRAKAKLVGGGGPLPNFAAIFHLVGTLPVH